MAPRVEVSTGQSETRQLRLSFYSGLPAALLLFHVWVRKSEHMNIVYLFFFSFFFLNSSFLLDPPHFNRHGCHMLRISLTHLTWLKGPNIDSNVLVTNNRKDFVWIHLKASLSFIEASSVGIIPYCLCPIVTGLYIYTDMIRDPAQICQLSLRCRKLNLDQI